MFKENTRFITRSSNIIGEIIALTLLEMETDWLHASKFFLITQDPETNIISITVREKESINVLPLAVPTAEQRKKALKRYNDLQVVITPCGDKNYAHIYFSGSMDHPQNHQVTIMLPQATMIVKDVFRFLKES